MRPVGPYGFALENAISGGIPGRLGAMAYTIDPSYATVIMAGDAVKRSGTGRNIERAGAGDTIIGFFTGCQYYEPDGEVIYRNYWPGTQPVQANSVITADVMDDPNAQMVVQMDGALTADNIGQLADLVQTSAPNLLSGTSGQQLASASIGSGAQFKIIGLSPKYASNMTYGDNNDVVVLPAAHELQVRAAV